MFRTAVLAAFAVLALGRSGWQRVIPIDKKALSPSGGGPYFVLKPGLHLEYRHGRKTQTTTVLSWLSAVNRASFGLMMPGAIKPGQKFYQEMAPGTAMDRAEIVAAGETVQTPAGVFRNCIHVRETSDIEKGAVDHKWYAPGIGMVKDGDLVLVRVSGQ